MRPVLVLLACLLLAGCAGSSKAPAPTATDAGPPPLVPADADYGGIEGFVFNPDVLPQANATIRLEGTDRSVVTDVLGYYALLPLEPGTHLLVVNETGFLPVRRAVSVLPGQGLRVDFALREVPVPEPYIDDAYIRRGHIDCQARVNATTNTNPDCTEAGEQATGPYLPPGRGANITIGPDAYAMLLELEWTPSVQTNDRLRLAVRPTEAETWKQFEGRSVLRVELDEAAMRQMSEFSQKDYRANGGQVFFLVFPGEAVNAGPGGAGATFQQDYTFYVTVFYRMGIPENYSRIAP